MTKEQQRILEIDACSRLPYAFKFISSMDKPFDEFGGQPIWTARGADVLFGDLCVTTLENSDAYALSSIKPVLLPLSDFTKEITIGGETFVPANNLSKGRHIVFENGSFWYLKTESEVSGPEKWCGAEKQIDLFELLNQWHFDYRGLINSGLAISVHDLPENPYEK